MTGRSVPGNRWDLLAGLEPAEPPAVSVIVVHYRQQAELDRTLAALRRQTHPADRTELIVVDDGSPEPPRVPAGVRLLRQADEGFRAYGGEDWEWAYRAWLGGAILAHDPAAVAWHDGPDWAGRGADDPARRARKDAETILLAGRIPVAGSRGRGLRGAEADVVIRLGAAPSPAAAFVCVDSLLAVLPEAVVSVPDEFAEMFAADQRVAKTAAHPPARVVIDVPVAVRADPVAGALTRAVASVGVGTLGTVLLGGVRIDSARARARRATWGADLFETRVDAATGLVPLTADPDLSGYLGGWA